LIEFQHAVIDVSGVAFRAGNRDGLTLPDVGGGGAAADNGRDAELAGDDGCMAEARFMTGSQSGSVMSATRTSPARTRDISFASLMMRAWPAPMRCPMLRPVASTLDLDLSVKRNIVRPARL
jgi:hypothetical protein